MTAITIPTSVLSLTALLLSLAALVETANRYTNAYLDAPREVTAFLDAIDSAVAENEAYDRDMAKVKRLDDKLRLSRLLREIQKDGDALREHLNALLLDGGVVADMDGEEGVRLRMTARLLWARHRVTLEDKVRRLDLLRMRFLAVHMGIVAGVATEASIRKDPEKVPLCMPIMAEAAPAAITTPPRPPPLPRALTDGLKGAPPPPPPPLRRMTTPSGGALSHLNNFEWSHRRGWLGVVEELQKSPLLNKRQRSIELAMAQMS